ncbi:hypothetical protein B0T26DRAFT_656359 [Lasiosphaeria miniovina]|uniref:AAA+ ATPase domain-containing protein n=1 Tax=Lasiosphaeria miniovina TaxID=1954250 RepID=A0AA40DKJ0_9PEZI|nr:uncharacterized protein B0T26DRAFT_656359 [Lasiosphaeria miniovina]KAK0706595.1 hypothetical protein B0T26DRAFT_656359 [Lasiosphaeria miniovina]
MSATGARALLSAPCAACAACASATRQVAIQRALPLSLSARAHGHGHRPSPRLQAVRSFRTSSPALSRPDDAEAAASAASAAAAAAEKARNPPRDTKARRNVAADPVDSDNGTADTPQAAADTASPAPEQTYKEATAQRTPGYGSARARAARAGARAEEFSPVQLPPWFMDMHISLYEHRPIGRPATALDPLNDEARKNVLHVLQSHFDDAAVVPADVDTWKFEFDRMIPLVTEEALDLPVARFRAVHRTALLQVLALLHRPDADPEHIEALRRHYADTNHSMLRLSWWADKSLSADAQRWLANLRPDPGIFHEPGLYGSPLASRPEPEYSVCMELLAAVRAQLVAEYPSTKPRNVQRPITVLSVLNRKGRSIAYSVIEDIATDLQADVVRLDAATIASILGHHLGQNLHSSRGPVSMLGFAAAEMNGRLASRSSPESMELGMITVNLPSRLRSFLSPKGSGLGSSTMMDDRWDDLKLNQALESLVAAAGAKRASEVDSGSGTERPLIIHVHDYVEMSAANDSIINKLRSIADRMWQKGRRVVLIGSSSTDIAKSPQLREQLIEMTREGTQIIPFHAAESSEWMEAGDNFTENTENIKNMLQAILGPSVDVDFDTVPDNFAHLDHLHAAREPVQDCLKLLQERVFDISWVYRLVSLMIGSRSPTFTKFNLSHLRYAMDFMADRDKHWTDISPGVRAPYFSPLTPKRSQNFGSSSAEEWAASMGMSGGPPSSTSTKEYDQHEKKLLSGLINAKDIHTTFEDIVVPKETKESLIGLTSLSLVRPDAFSYGVLKTERIPGCLLYGPPGTGKTLLAKAVAKESGANMLEVSAASINDMYLGQSEKNVRALFSLARKMAPMVIFLDEADALLGARHNTFGRTGHRETITQFLREWDGLSDMRAFIMVATNRPFDLDEAVLRRLPRKILVDLPLATERAEILRVMLREEQLAPDVDLATLAADADLYSGSDLKNLCVSAAMEAVREENRARDAHDCAQAEAAAAAEPFVFPPKRILTRAHFDKGLREISASISEDMDSLKAIRKFDQQYGDAGRRRKTRRGMGFEVVPDAPKGTDEARVRQVVAGVVV